MALDWQLATVTSVRDETPTVRTFTLGLTGWDGHRPGQHVDLRLTAEDGYSVERSYSIASEPERGSEIDITVERIPGGEVSPFLHDIVVPGDRLEVDAAGGQVEGDAEQAGAVLDVHHLEAAGVHEGLDQLSHGVGHAHVTPPSSKNKRGLPPTLATTRYRTEQPGKYSGRSSRSLVSRQVSQ